MLLEASENRTTIERHGIEHGVTLQSGVVYARADLQRVIEWATENEKPSTPHDDSTEREAV